MANPLKSALASLKKEGVYQKGEKVFVDLYGRDNVNDETYVFFVVTAQGAKAGAFDCKGDFKKALATLKGYISSIDSTGDVEYQGPTTPKENFERQPGFFSGDLEKMTEKEAERLQNHLRSLLKKCSSKESKKELEKCRVYSSTLSTDLLQYNNVIYEYTVRNFQEKLKAM